MSLKSTHLHHLCSSQHNPVTLLITVTLIPLILESFCRAIETHQASPSDSQYGTNPNGTHIFKYHCSPWVNSPIWYKIHSKPKITCDSDSCRKSDETLDQTASSQVSTGKTPNDPDRAEQQIDTIVLEESSKSSSSSFPSSWWPTHPLPRRMTDNLSPEVCRYTGLESNESLDWMQDYLHIMRSYNYNECLLFDNESIGLICRSQPRQRIEKLKYYNFGHCDRYPLTNVLSDEAWARVISSNVTLCVQVLRELNLLDSLANDIYCHFEDLLSRYNCESYSIKGTCSACKKAYKEWVCSMVLPFYFDGIYIKPCRSFCEKVEQKCPYLHPATTYAGEPVFICIDPKIPYFRNSSNIPYGSPEECYKSCHLANESTDLYSDKNDSDQSCLSYEMLLANVLKKSLQEEMDDWKHRYGDDDQSSSNHSDSINETIHQFNAVAQAYHSDKVNQSDDADDEKASPQTNNAHSGSKRSDRRRWSRDRMSEVSPDSLTTDSGAQLDQSVIINGPGKMMMGHDDRDEERPIPSLSLPLDDDGSEDEGERDEDGSISTTSSASSTLPTSSSTHFSVPASLPNADIHLTLSSAFHFSLILLVIGLLR